MNRTARRSSPIRGLVAALAFPLTALACSGDAAGPGDDGGPPQVASVVVSAAVDTLVALDETVQLEAVARDADGNELPGRDFEWGSSNEQVVVVDSAGVATAVSDGEAEVTAMTDGVTGAAPLAVIQLVSEVVVEPAADTLTTVGATTQFSAGAVDENGNAVEGARRLWQSSNPSGSRSGPGRPT